MFLLSMKFILIITLLVNYNVLITVEYSNINTIK